MPAGAEPDDLRMSDAGADFQRPLATLASGITCLALVALGVAAFASGYYSHACAGGGMIWGLFMPVMFLLASPLLTVPAWLALAVALARVLRPARSMERYLAVVAGSLLALAVLFCAGLLLAVARGTTGGCSFGF